MTSLCFFVQLPDRTSILAKGVFLVLMIGKSLLLNHSPSEWFSLYKKQDGIYSSALFFVGSADLCLYGAGLPFHALCRPARRPHAAGVGKCCPGSNLQTHGVGASAILRTVHPESLCPRRGHGKPSCKCCPQLKSVIFYPVIPVCIVASVRSKSLSELVKPLPRLNGSAGWPVAGIISPHAAPGSRRHQ